MRLPILHQPMEGLGAKEMVSTPFVTFYRLLATLAQSREPSHGGSWGASHWYLMKYQYRSSSRSARIVTAALSCDGGNEVLSSERSGNVIDSGGMGVRRAAGFPWRMTIITSPDATSSNRRASFSRTSPALTVRITCPVLRISVKNNVYTKVSEEQAISTKRRARAPRWTSLS